MRIVAYTAIFGGYDKIVPPKNPNPNVDYVLFTDRAAKTSVWQVVQTTVKGLNPRKSSRHFKILAHKHFPDADITIWHGGWLILHGDPTRAIEYLGDHDIAMEPHKERSCLYQEARVCIQRRLASKYVVKRQIAAYRKDGFPANYGLTSAFFIVRRNTERVAEMERLWWQQVKNHSGRDQVSLMYCLWKCGLDYSKMPIGPSKHGLYRTQKHAK
jgi:hypothetical protein